MAFAVGTRICTQAGSTSRGPRLGVIEEVLRGDPSARYRVRWDDGRESVLTPADGSLMAIGRGPRRAAPRPAPKAAPAARKRTKTR